MQIETYLITRKPDKLQQFYYSRRQKRNHQIKSSNSHLNTTFEMLFCCTVGPIFIEQDFLTFPENQKQLTMVIIQPVVRSLGLNIKLFEKQFLFFPPEGGIVFFTANFTRKPHCNYIFCHLIKQALFVKNNVHKYLLFYARKCILVISLTISIKSYRHSRSQTPISLIFFLVFQDFATQKRFRIKVPKIKINGFKFVTAKLSFFKS